MKKSKLLALALVLLISVGTLAGSTIAWFTDSVTSAGNKIQAGTLQLEVAVQSDKNSVFETLSDDKPNTVFDYELWEPGYTTTRGVQIKNAGSLALKYELNIIPNGEGELSALANVIDVYSNTAWPTSRTDLGVCLGTLADIVNGTVKINGNLAAEAADDVRFLTLKMREEAGNEYQGLSIGTTFDLQVLATQDTVEYDSFDNQYDADAPAWTGETDMDWYLANPDAAEFEISTAEELASLAGIVNGTAEGVEMDNFSGQTIRLTADIDLGNRPWEPIGVNYETDSGLEDTPFMGTFDGQGHTVSNLYIHIEDDRDSVGFFGYAKNATIKGLTIENADIDADYFVGAIVGNLYVGQIADCHVEGNIKINARRNYAAGIVGDGYYSMEGCSVIAEGTGSISSKAVAGGLCGRINEGNHFIKNCTVKNLDIKSGQQIAAITGFLHYGNTVSGCTVENVNLTLEAAKAMKPAIGLASGLWQYKEGNAITICDNSFRNITINASANVTGKTDILYGWEWNDRLAGVVASNNTMENVTNNLVYPSDATV